MGQRWETEKAMKLQPQNVSRRFYGVIVALTLATMAGGCGPQGLPDLVPVEGTVTYRGAPLAEGELRYIPQDPSSGRMARGKIREGSFSLTTARRDDGVKPGKYQVVVIAYGREREPERDAQGFVTKAHPRPLLVPEQYTKPETTPLTDVVDEDHSGEIQFELVD